MKTRVGFTGTYIKHVLVSSVLYSETPGKKRNSRASKTVQVATDNKETLSKDGKQRPIPEGKLCPLHIYHVMLAPTLTHKDIFKTD